MEALYHPDSIFGDEETWYDAPVGLPAQHAQEYFDALEEQDVLGDLSENRYVHNPRTNHYPKLPTATLQNKITKFITAHHLTNDDAEYVQLSRVSNKLVDLQEDHEDEMRVQDRKINSLVEELSAVRTTRYEIENIYSGSDCKRKRDLIVAKATPCFRSKARLEEQYLGAVSVLAEQVQQIKGRVRSARDARRAQERWRPVLEQVRNIVEQNARLEGGVADLRAEVGRLRAHLRAHRNAVILERRRRDAAFHASQTYLARLNEGRDRERDLEVEVNQQARIMQQQANWIHELEARGMRNEVFDRQNGSWKMARATRKRRFNEDREEEEIKEERGVKRERLY
ncbi:hypothetical protein EYC84_003743 [Monilinia fructicola]|uniref:Uncharacterized protein n=1 Tax=Monilinia fructicola TaxID=38448 RepID=A0A5M9JYL8_MONFR|nr:hypothetical protein EYC84_003743 [Monilinia fructicola]